MAQAGQDRLGKPFFHPSECTNGSFPSRFEGCSMKGVEPFVAMLVVEGLDASLSWPFDALRGAFAEAPNILGRRPTSFRALSDAPCASA